MRRIVAGLHVSLDGVVETPDQWVGPYMNNELGQAIGAMIGASDTLLMGRVGYEGFAGYWAEKTSDVPFADFMNNTPKCVVSTSLDTVEWKNSTLIKDDVVKAITRLKEEPGENIGITGSATLIRSLLRDKLLDELNLLVYPIVVGSGKRLFEDGGDRTCLSLVASKSFSTGVAMLTYEPADRPDA